MNTEAIKPDLMVHARGDSSMRGAPGVHVGTVDHLDGEKWIKLAKSDSVDGRHHWIPVDWVERVDDKAIYLNKDAAAFREEALDEKPSTLH